MVKAIDKIRQAIPVIAKHKRIGMYELAQDSGIHYTTLNRFLTGKREINISKLESIADSLGMTVVGLINWKRK